MGKKRQTRSSSRKEEPKKEQKVNKKQQKKHQKAQQKEANNAECQEKSKPIVKARKYKNKSIEQKKRIQKSKTQRIFLLSAQRNAQNWSFTVQGTKGSTYYVYVSTYVSCTCMDFRLRQSVCKHIYFIVTQVGQNDELLDYFKKDRKISKNAYKLLDQQLASRLKSRLQKPTKDAKQIDLKDDTDCVICFSQMNKQEQALEDCSTCKKYFHSQCILAWKANNPTCPLCRGSLVATLNGNTDDPLGKLVGVKL